MSATLPIAASSRVMPEATATGGQTNFAYTFPIQDDGDLKVTRTRAGIKTVLALATDYTVTNVGVAGGGNVVLGTGAIEGDKILVEGLASIERITNVTREGKFRSAVTDAELDRLTIIAQEARRDIGRTLKVASSVAIEELPAPEAGKALVGNSTNDGYINADLEAGNAAAAEEAMEGAIEARAEAEDEADRAEQEADRAETAASSAATLVGLYENTTAGIAGTVDGEVFGIPGADDAHAIDLYRNDSESATDLDKHIPSAKHIAAIDAQLVIIEDGVYRTNLFDLAAITDDFVISHTTGELVSNASYYTSDFMPVVAGEDYILSSTFRTVWFDEDQVLISGDATVEDDRVVTAPVGAAFLRISNQSNKPAAAVMIVHGDTLPSTYIAFGKVLDGASILPGTIGTESIADGTITFDKVDFLAKTKNLFNNANVVSGFIGADGGVVEPSADYVYGSDYIPVEPDTDYHGEGSFSMRFWCFYSSPGVQVSGGSNTGGTDFTTTSETNFVRVTIWAADIDNFQLELGTSRTSFAPFGYKLSPDGSGAGSDEGGWAGQVWGQMGDSNTAGDSWPADVGAAVGLIFADYGAGGTQVGGASDSTTAMFSDTRVEAIPEDTDVVTVMGGTNDWFNNRVLGSANSTTSTDFNGALNLMIEKLLARFPDKFIALATPPYTEALTYVSKGWANAYTNTQGLTPNDYAEAIRAACKRYNLPCIDVQAEAGWNRFNIDEYVLDDSELLHFGGQLGAERVKAVYAAFFRRHEPLS